MSEHYHFIIGSSPEGIRLLSDDDDLSAYEQHLQAVSLPGGEYLIRNIGDSDDVIVNRKKAVMARVSKTTRIDIGKTPFSIHDLQNKGIIGFDAAEAVRSEAHPVTRNSIDLSNVYVRKYDKDLANNVSLSIKSGEFVGIIGPSGAGKSILLKAIRGIEPITGGDIFINSQNISENKQLRRKIGFVPQDDVVYPALTVEENISFAAKLRLPSDWTKQAIEDRVNQVIRQVALEDCRKSRVSEISGGQRKRVNLANELVSEPDFILADEICSGLSAYDANNIVRHLRNLADSGKIIMMTIHTPDIETLDYMDMLLVYDKGGFIAYYGPPRKAMEYFSGREYSVYTSPKKIFDVLEKTKESHSHSTAELSPRKALPKRLYERFFGSPEKTSHSDDKRKIPPEKWNSFYRSTDEYKEYIEGRLRKQSADDDKSSKDNSVPPSDNHLSKSLPKQILYLTQRRLKAFFRDKADVLITFGQAPLMALAFFFVFQGVIQPGSLLPQFFQPLRRYATPDIIIFLAVLAAVWFGFDKAIFEIPASKTYYEQERLSFLKNSAFILSRFFALSIITFGQVVLFVLFFHAEFVMIPNMIFATHIPFFSMMTLLMKFALLLWLTSIASVATAMFISFPIKSASAAKAILPFIIILQILFGGSRIQPLKDMNNFVYGFSHVMVSRWGFEAAALLFEFNLKRFPSEEGLILDSDRHSLVNKKSYVINNALERMTDEEALGIDKDTDKEKIKERVEILLKADAEIKEPDRVWDWMISINPKVRFFKPPNAKVAWMMLCVISILAIILLRISYQLRRWRDSIV